MKSPINAEKHYVQWSLTNVASGAASTQVIAQGVDILAKNLSSEVREGAVVKAVYVEVWLGTTSTTTKGTILMSIIKTGDLQTPNFTDQTALNSYANKKNVLYHTQGLTNQDGSVATPFYRGWIKIPKGKQRIASGDTLFLIISSQTEQNEYCGFATYKEYF